MDTADRILGDPGEHLASKMVCTVRGTVNGTVLVAVAEGLGFEDPAYFSRIFRKHTGRAPLEFRQSLALLGA